MQCKTGIDGVITPDIRRGEMVIVFYPQCDIDLLRRIFAEAERAGRLGEFFVFHLGHRQIPARCNPVCSFSPSFTIARSIRCKSSRIFSPPMRD